MPSALPSGGVVAEVVGLVKHHQIVVVPVERGQVEVADRPPLAAEVGVRKHIVAEAVCHKGVEQVVARVNRPVLAELLGAQHQGALVAQLEILDDRQRLVGLAQPHAVGEDAAVVRQQLVDRSLHPVLLKGEERLPDFRLKQRGLLQFRISLPGGVQIRLKEVEEGLVVHELWSLIAVHLFEVEQHFLGDILHQFRVVPQLVEPRLQVDAVAVAVHNQVEFEVVAVLGQSQPTHGEVGAAEQSCCRSFPGQVVELAVQEVGLAHRADADLLPNPLGAVAGDGFLGEHLGELQSGSIHQKRLGFRAFRVEVLDKPRLAEEETQTPDARQFLLERVVRVNREEGRNDREVGTFPKLRLQEIRNPTASVVVPNAGKEERLGDACACAHEPFPFASS